MIPRVFEIQCCILAAAIVAVLCGCDREDAIRTYRSPKVTAATNSQQSTLMAPDSNAISPRRLTWALPEGWSDQPGDGAMRFATLLDTRKTPTLTVTVTKLSSQAGSLLSNVNRWRQQIGLPPVELQNLHECTRAIDGGDISGVLADLTSESNGSSAPSPQRMLAAIFETPDATWFFKTTGAKESIDAAESDLLALFASVQVENSPAPLTSGIDITQPNVADSKLLKYTVPEGWREDATPRTARIATLIVDNEGKTELAITRFPGDVGGELANVNRWRGQLGLAPVPSLDLQPASDITIARHAARMYQLTNETMPANLAMAVALVKHDDHTWFFKMTGPASTVAHERERFEQFLESVTFDVSQ